MPAIVAAMTGAARLRPSAYRPPRDPQGKSGHFCDKALEGVSHHAIVPNVNVMDDLEARHRPPQRRREAPVRPDLPLLPRCHHAGLRVPPDRGHDESASAGAGADAAVEFRAVGRIPSCRVGRRSIRRGRAEPGREKGERPETEQTLPQLDDGQTCDFDPATRSGEADPAAAALQ